MAYKVYYEDVEIGQEIPVFVHENRFHELEQVRRGQR
jgi:hypothetical protein